MKTLFSYLLLVIVLVSCDESDYNQLKNHSKKSEVKLKDLIPINLIDSVEMKNNYGNHMVKQEKLLSFKNKLKGATLERVSLKMGAIHFSIFIKGKRIPFTGRTHGNYIESYSGFFPKDKVPSGELYFKVNDFNLDNY